MNVIKENVMKKIVNNLIKTEVTGKKVIITTKNSVTYTGIVLFETKDYITLGDVVGRTQSNAPPWSIKGQSQTIYNKDILMAVCRELETTFFFFDA